MNILGYNNTMNITLTPTNHQALVKSQRAAGCSLSGSWASPHAHHTSPQHPKPDKTRQFPTLLTEWVCSDEGESALRLLASFFSNNRRRGLFEKEYNS